jgi:hypothetical protein
MEDLLCLRFRQEEDWDPLGSTIEWPSSPPISLKNIANATTWLHNAQTLQQFVFQLMQRENMRPVQKSKTNANYPHPVTFTFSGRSVNRIKKVLKRNSAAGVPVRECLGAWLRQVEGRNPLGGTKSDQKQAVDAIRNKVDATYKLAAVALTKELGAFCSYCGTTPLPGLLEVEHWSEAGAGKNCRGDRGASEDSDSADACCSRSAAQTTWYQGCSSSYIEFSETAC